VINPNGGAVIEPPLVNGLHFNCGGKAFTDDSGIKWISDDAITGPNTAIVSAAQQQLVLGAPPKLTQM